MDTSCVGVPFNTTFFEPLIAKSGSESVRSVDNNNNNNNNNNYSIYCSDKANCPIHLHLIRHALVFSLFDINR